MGPNGHPNGRLLKFTPMAFPQEEGLQQKGTWGVPGGEAGRGAGLRSSVWINPTSVWINPTVIKEPPGGAERGGEPPSWAGLQRGTGAEAAPFEK